MNLESYKKRKAGILSGGNKRKLQTALSLIGGSKIIFLDEASAGMDTSSRKKLYNHLRKMKNQSVLLVTQRIEEAE